MFRKAPRSYLRVVSKMLPLGMQINQLLKDIRKKLVILFVRWVLLSLAIILKAGFLFRNTNRRELTNADYRQK